MVLLMVDISVIVPVYNVARYLPQCLDSIVNQTFEDIEIICINDGSTDDSLEILESYSKKDSRIKIISQENRGLGAARNVGMKHASGRYVFFIDSDDFIKQNTLELLYDNAVSNNSDMVFYRLYRYIDGKESYNSLFNFKKHFGEVDYDNFTFTYRDAKDFVLNNGFSACIKLYSRKFLDSIPDFYFSEGIAFEDVVPHVKVMIKASRISFIPDFLYYYRSNTDSLVNNPENAFDILKVIDMVEDVLRQNNLLEEFQLDFDYFKFKRVNFHLPRSNSEEFFQESKRICSEIECNNLFRKSEAERYELILQSENFIEYLLRLYSLDTAKLKGKIRKAKKDLSKAESENKKLKKELSKLKEENKKSMELNDEILKSNSWKVTRPLRKVTNTFKKS